jgi:hypothetical protein
LGKETIGVYALLAPDLTDVTIQDIYAALVNDISRNEMIANDIVRAIESGRCPLLLTGRTEHLQYFAAKLKGVAKQVFVFKGGMGKKQRRQIAANLAAVCRCRFTHIYVLHSLM